MATALALVGRQAIPRRRIERYINAANKVLSKVKLYRERESGLVAWLAKYDMACLISVWAYQLSAWNGGSSQQLLDAAVAEWKFTPRDIYEYINFRISSDPELTAQT